MPIIRCSDQPNETLQEFYSDEADFGNNNKEYYTGIGNSMLLIIDFINNNFIETKIYGLTSVYKLNLLANDSWTTPWYVSIISNSIEFTIEYLIPNDKSPWPNARISGKGKTVEALTKYLIIAMKNSEGWPKNEELEKLYNKYK